jgi:hypothetical protein
MTTDDEILKELKWQSKLIEAEFALLTDIKFELINSRKLSDYTYTVPLPKTPALWERFWYWVKGKIKE